MLAQNIEQDVFISMIKSKLPKDVLLQIELQKVLFVLRLNVPVNNFSVMSGRSHRFLGN